MCSIFKEYSQNQGGGGFNPHPNFSKQNSGGVATPQPLYFGAPAVNKQYCFMAVAIFVFRSDIEYVT